MTPPANGHGGRLTIDLAAVVANWRMLAAMVAPAGCAAVVKADAYGLGLEAAGGALHRAGCRRFFVAHLSEGLRLRAIAPQAEIGVLNGLPSAAIGPMRAAGLIPVIGDAAEHAAWREAGGGAYALHVDTGMNRLGLPLEEAMAMIGAGALDADPPAWLMSHFVSSEAPDDPLNALQIDRFGAIDEAMRARPREIAQPSRSLSNTSGIFLKDRPFHDFVRPGYGLYGGNPTPGRANPMREVVRLTATILGVRTVPAGGSVGYNAAWTARRESRIATLSVGYADGLPRSLASDAPNGGGVAMVGGVRCPFVGRVSMDLVTLDVTDAPTSIGAGDEAVLIGEGIGVDEVAKRAGTNGYEILTSLGSRYERELMIEPMVSIWQAGTREIGFA